MKKTPAFILIILAVVILADFYFIYKDGASESISAYIIRYSKDFQAIPFAFGFVMGHLFWRMPDKRVGK